MMADKQQTKMPEKDYGDKTGFEGKMTPKGSHNGNASSGSGAEMLDADGRKGGEPESYGGN